MRSGCSNAFPLKGGTPIAVVHRGVDARLAIDDKIFTSQRGLPDDYDIGAVKFFLRDVCVIKVVVVMGLDVESRTQDVQEEIG